jgi:DNA-binding PadR family transcriptional regulator
MSGRPAAESTMDVKTVCLGMLTYGEASGYDLKKFFESSFAHCFAAGYGSIYPALASLAEQGLVGCREVPQEGKPDRKVYSITARGRQRLLDELDNPEPSHKVRSEFLAQICFAELMTPEQIRTILDSRIKDARNTLKLIDDFEVSCDDEGCEQDWPPGVQFTLGFAREMLRAQIKYVEQNRNMFDEESEPAANTAVG